MKQHLQFVYPSGVRFGYVMCWIFLLFLPTGLLAQNEDDTPSEDGDDIDVILEDAILGSEVDEDVDFTFITDNLEDFRKRPLDLNRASRDELRLLPGMNDLLITNLQSHIEQFGDLLTIYELQAVAGFTEDVVLGIQPFVVVEKSAKQDISPGSLHPKGPPVREILEGLQGDIIQRFVFITEEQKGYTAPDTNANGELSTRYVGGKVRSYSRVRMRFKNNFSVALTGEKDSGEAFKFDPHNNQLGYDYLSGHLSIGDYGGLKRLVVGDYNIQVGQGLVLSPGLGFGKGAETINTLKMPNKGIRPYSSVNENAYLRGAAATYAVKNLYFTAFFSRVGLDATVQDRDTLTNEALQVSSIRLGGLHRTESELEARKSIKETSFGGRIEYRKGRFMVGTTHLFQKFDTPILKDPKFYNQYDFTGDQNYVNGLDFDVIFNNFNFFGEFARSKSGGFGGVVGMMSSIAHKMDLAIHVRNFSKDFHSLKGYVFAERPVSLQNERGLYVGIKIKPTPKWLITGYVDQYFYPQPRSTAAYASSGFEVLGQVQYKPRRHTLIYARFRSDNKEENQSSANFLDGQQVRYVVPTQRNAFRLHFQTRIGRDLILRNRAEFGWFRKGDNAFEKGFMIYQDIVWKITFDLKLTARYALFDTDSFNTAIYAYENDILGFFSVPPYSGRGSRYYAILNYKLPKGFEIWLRYAQTNMHDAQNLLGSGLESTGKPRRSEVKAQIRWKF